MEIYANLRGNSQITNYQINKDSITIWFKGGKNYTYSYQKAGMINVENMKKLARNGFGLSAYITKNVRKDYD